MSNFLYILGTVISAEALCAGADYRGIGGGLILLGVVTLVRYYVAR